MRQRFLSEFDSLWFDCMNGDSRETGKLTPDGKPDPSVCDGAQLRERRREGIDTLRDWKDKSLAPQGVAHVSTPTERAIRLFRALAEYEGPVGNGRFRSPRYDSPNRGITRYVGKGLSGLPAGHAPEFCAGADRRVQGFDDDLPRARVGNVRFNQFHSVGAGDEQCWGLHGQ